MRRTLYITLTTALIGYACNASAQSELKAFENLKNRITINHDDGSKEIFIVTPEAVKAKTAKTYHWYESQKLHETKGGYSGKLLDGTYSHFFHSKDLLSQGQYKKGLKHGKWKTWWPNNNLKKVELWKKGQKNGTAVYYNEEGILSMKGKMVDDAWHGKVWVLAPTDSTYKVTYYSQGININHDEYTNSNLFRRTGSIFKKIFSKKKENDQIVP